MNPVTIALETATDALSVAVQGDGGPMWAREVVGMRRHASDLLPLLDSLLSEAGATRHAIQRVVLSDGPGSFTGLRVGAAVAKAIARVGGARVFTVPSLLGRVRAAQVTGRVLAVSDALRGELYAGAWSVGDRVECLMPPRAISADHLAGLPRVDAVVGEGAAPLLTQLASCLGVGDVRPGAPTAAALLALLDAPGAATPVADVGAWEPEYGRPAEAQARWERAHGRPLPDSIGNPR